MIGQTNRDYNFIKIDRCFKFQVKFQVHIVFYKNINLTIYLIASNEQQLCILVK